MINFLTSKNFYLLLAIFVLTIFWQSYILNLIFPVHFNPRNIFFSDLIDHPLTISLWLGYVFGFMDMLLLYMIGRKLFSSDEAFLPTLIFGISPWTAYLLAAESIYPFIVCLILFIGYGLLLLDSSKQLYGKILIILGSVAAFYSSLYMIIVMPLFFICAIFLKIVSFNKIKFVIFAIVILLLPLVIFMNINFGGVKNLFAQQITIFADPGVIQSNNAFQGQAQKDKMGILSKIAENKYEHLLRYSVLKTLNNLAPAVYFTPQEKLLGFSFSPPIYLGFIIPFFYGLYKVLCSSVLRKYFIFSLILTIPSVLSQQQVELNRLFIIMPSVIILISYGLINLYHQRKQMSFRVVLYSVLGLIFFQMVLVGFDVSAREHQRYLKYFSITNVEIGRQ